MRQIEIYTKTDNLPKLLPGSPMHSAEMFGILSRQSNAKPYLFVCKEQEKEIAHLLVIRHRRFRFIPPGIYTWYSIYGEGVYSTQCVKEREDIFAMFLDELFKLFDFRHTFIEVRNLSSGSFAYKVLSDREFFPRRCIRIYNSLHSKEPHERLTRAYKAHIRKAEKRGVTYGQATSATDIESGLSLLHKYYISKIRTRLPQKNILRNMLINEKGELSQQIRLFVVRHKSRIIGSSICLYDNDRTYIAYSCGLRKRHPLLYPGIVAIWAAITDAHRRGYAHFEFSETNLLARKSSGYINTVLNFGGKQVSTIRWCHFKWNGINKILRAIYV